MSIMHNSSSDDISSSKSCISKDLIDRYKNIKYEEMLLMHKFDITQIISDKMNITTIPTSSGNDSEDTSLTGLAIVCVTNRHKRSNITVVVLLLVVMVVVILLVVVVVVVVVPT